MQISMTALLNRFYSYVMDIFQDTAISILIKGRIPRHIAFILDGNRRYAKKIGAKATDFGHREGCNQLKKVIELCFKLGIQELTVYAFSIENFKRTKEEVDCLMGLFREFSKEVCEEDSPIMRHGVRIQVMGDLSYLPEDVADLSKKMMKITEGHRGTRFNICCPYTSRNEMTSSIKQNIQMVKNGELDLKDISQKSIEDHLFTSKSYPLDLLVRTSGEIRLSDFLLYQATRGCQIQFIDCLWPEVNLWKLLPVILEYQLYHDSVPRN